MQRTIEIPSAEATEEQLPNIAAPGIGLYIDSGRLFWVPFFAQKKVRNTNSHFWGTLLNGRLFPSNRAIKQNGIAGIGQTAATVPLYRP